MRSNNNLFGTDSAQCIAHTRLLHVDMLRTEYVCRSTNDIYVNEYEWTDEEEDTGTTMNYNS